MHFHPSVHKDRLLKGALRVDYYLRQFLNIQSFWLGKINHTLILFHVTPLSLNPLMEEQILIEINEVWFEYDKDTFRKEIEIDSTHTHNKTSNKIFTESILNKLF